MDFNNFSLTFKHRGVLLQNIRISTLPQEAEWRFQGQIPTQLQEYVLKPTFSFLFLVAQTLKQSLYERKTWLKNVKKKFCTDKMIAFQLITDNWILNYRLFQRKISREYIYIYIYLDSYKHIPSWKKTCEFQCSFPSEIPAFLPLQDLCLMEVFVFLRWKNTIILLDVKSNNWYRPDILECE